MVKKRKKKKGAEKEEEEEEEAEPGMIMICFIVFRKVFFFN